MNRWDLLLSQQALAQAPNKHRLHWLRSLCLAMLLLSALPSAILADAQLSAEAPASPAAAPALTIAEILDITYVTGHRMRAAGFDRAENIRYGRYISYAMDRDRLLIDDFTVTNPELMQQVEGLDPVEIHTSVAAHEHCHAFLAKQRNKLPPAVARASETCSVLPLDRYDHFFDEIYCDMAAISVVGKTAERMFEWYRQHEDRADPDSPERYKGHSYPVFKLALAALDPREKNPVKRAAKAMETSCRAPEVQALAGVFERRFSTKLTDTLATFTVVPKTQVAPISVPTVKEWRRGEGRRFEKVRLTTKDGPPMLFVAAYNACQAHFARHGLPDSPWPARAMQRCKLDRQAFDSAYCVVVAGDVAKASLSATESYRDVTDEMFGRQSLASQIIQDQIDYRISIYDFEGPSNPKDISLRVEFACGAKPDELSDVTRAEPNLGLW